MAGRITTGVALTLMLALGSCSGISPLGFLTGGGPNVAANGQIGAENNQGINVDYNSSARVPEIRPEGPVDTINQTTNNNEIDPFLIILLVLGWLAPSPNEIGRGILSLFKRK
jgi:hypothetical protein